MAVATDLDSTQSLLNLARNGGFEEWLASGLPAYWALKTGAAPQQNTDTVLSGNSALFLETISPAWDTTSFDAESFSEGGSSSITYDAVGNTTTLNAIQGKTVTVSVSVNKSAGAEPRVSLDDGVNVETSGYGCHAGEWQTITIQKTVENTATKLEVALSIEGEDKSAVFDDVMLTLGSTVLSFTPNPSDTSDPANQDQTAPSSPVGFAAYGRPVSVLLTWNTVDEAGVSLYEVQQATDQYFVSGVETYSTATTHYTVVPSDRSTYWFRVRAVKTSGARSAWATPLSAAATGLQLSQFNDEIRGIDIVDALPALPSATYGVGSVVFLSTDKKLYRCTGTVWTAAIDVSDINGQITSTQIADSAITTPKLAANSVTGNNIVGNTIGANHLMANSVTAGAIQAGAIGASHVRTDTAVITTGAQIADAVIDNAKITNLAVDNAKIANLTLTTGKIANNAITATDVMGDNSTYAQGNYNETVVATLTVSSDGGSSLVWAKGTVGSDGGSALATVRIRKDSVYGQELDQTSATCAYSDNCVVCAGLDTAPASTQTYVFTVQWLYPYSAGDIRSIRMMRMNAKK